MIRLKRHSVMTLELASRGGWIDSHRCQFLVGQASTRCALDFSTQALDQFGRTFVRIHRMTTQTGTITIMQPLGRGCEKIDILARRLFRRASRPAENSCRAHSNKKYAFEARVAVHQCAIHRFGWRKKFECFHMRSTPKV